MSPTTTATPTFSLATGNWQMWLLAIAGGFIVSYALTSKKRKTEYYDADGNRISKQEFDQLE